MPIGYRNVSGTIYQIGPTVEEWEPVAELTVTDTGSGTSKKKYPIDSQLSEVSDYSRLRIKLKCSSAGTFTSETAASSCSWWVWIDTTDVLQADATNRPACLLVFKKNRTGSSGGTFDFSTFANKESAWLYLNPLAPTGYITSLKTLGNASGTESDPGRFYYVADSFDSTAGVALSAISFNDNTAPIILHTYCRGTFSPTNTGTAYSGTRTFTYKLIVEGIRHKPALKVSSTILD